MRSLLANLFSATFVLFMNLNIFQGATDGTCMGSVGLPHRTACSGGGRGHIHGALIKLCDYANLLFGLIPAKDLHKVARTSNFITNSNGVKSPLN
jgi:hypothetical protein